MVSEKKSHRTKDCNEMIFEIYHKVNNLSTTLLGTPGTDDKGVCGDVKETKEQLVRMNGNVRSLSRKFWVFVGVIIGLGSALGSELPVAIRSIIGG